MKKQRRNRKARPRKARGPGTLKNAKRKGQKIIRQGGRIL